MAASAVSEEQVAEALLEWLNSLDVAEQPVQDLAEMSDGRLLLHVMHEVSEDGFVDPHLAYATHLVEGLVRHLEGRTGCGAARAKQLRRSLCESQALPTVASLARLVVWATIENDLPWQPRYVQVLQSLRESSQQVMKTIIEEFSAAAPDEDLFSPGLSPSKSSAGQQAVDFMEPGLDLETRFRALKQQYLTLKEEQEAWMEERASLLKDAEAEREQRRSVEEAGRERKSVLGLRDAHQEEAHEELEQKQLLMDAELTRLKDDVRQRDKQLARLQEEVDAARSRETGSAELLAQLKDAKEKAEESSRLRRQNKELQAKLDGILAAKSQPVEGSAEHLRLQLERSRSELSDLMKDRDEALQQVHQLKEKVEKLQQSEREASSEAVRVQAKLEAIQEQHGGAGGSAGGGAGGRDVLGDVTLDELRKLHSQKDQLMERLLAEATRASKAEAELKAQRAEAAKLESQKTEAEEAKAAVEEQLKKLAQAGGAGGTAEVQALQSSLALKDRELQVYRWRERTDSDAGAAQERFLVSCFHQLGLRFHKLQAQQAMMEMRLSAMEKSLDG